MIDFNSSVWKNVTQWAELELERARVKNDTRMTELDTAALRGEIGFIKRLLALPKMSATLAKMVEPQDLDY